MKPKDWQQLADDYAAKAHTRYFASRSGAWAFESDEIVVVYDNAPCDKTGQIRLASIDHFYTVLHAAGIELLAQGRYPSSGPDAGYTWTAILSCSAQLRGAIAGMWQASVLHALQTRT